MDARLQEYLLSYSLEGIVITDLSGNITTCNETALQILGYPGRSLEGQHISALFPHAGASHLLPNLIHLALETSGFDGQIMLQGADGEQVMVRLIAQAWTGKEPRSILFRFLDWRETHEIVRQLRESSQMAVLGNLTRSISHEILNPIAVIGAYTRRLLDPGKKSTNHQEWTRQVLSSVERLEDLVETLQAYMDLPSPRFIAASLNEVLDRSVEKIRMEADVNGVHITDRKGKRLAEGFIDPRLMETAFTTVLVNALKRMPSGGELEVVREAGKDRGTITISDTGPSLDLKQLEEDLSPVHLMGGEQFHLNLAIARRIVDEHGGRFDLGSFQPQGLTVRITLPTDRRTVARKRGL